MEELREKRYRLRKGSRIMGFSRVIGKSTYYSSDSFWWNGTAIEHEERDEATGYRDKNSRLLYENDIIRARYSDPFRKSALFRIIRKQDELILCHMESGLTESLSHLERMRSIEWISYVFINLEPIFGISNN